MSQRIPPIQCLQAFEALARWRDLNGAAGELCVTPSAVCHRVKKLEDSVGVRLFEPKGYTLTAAGWAYLENVKYGLGCLQRFPG